MKMIILLDPQSCFDSGESFDDGHIEVVDIDATGIC